MKNCNDCRCTLPLEAFGAYRSSKDGLQLICKLCRGLRSAAWTDANPDKVKARNREKRPLTEAKKVRQAEWANANRDKVRANAKKWRTSHRDQVAAKTRKRQIAKLKATPQWANEFFVDEAYHLAKIRTDLFGFPWHVDHIVPLNSPIVCGLHNEFNLQVIPAVENIKKGNRHWPDMP